jgi:RNA polymerase sigma factor (sigma-70 family)
VRHAYSIARRILPADAARDVAQETWIKFQRHVQTEQPDWSERRARSWIWSVASNAARSALRRKRPHGMDPDLPLPAASDPCPAEEALAREERDARASLAREILTRLAPAERRLVGLRTFEERSWKEIAAILDENPRTLRSRYSRLLARLRAEEAAQPAAAAEDPHV